VKRELEGGWWSARRDRAAFVRTGLVSYDDDMPCNQIGRVDEPLGIVSSTSHGALQVTERAMVVGDGRTNTLDLAGLVMRPPRVVGTLGVEFSVQIAEKRHERAAEHGG
jgi:hypothetical protein